MARRGIAIQNRYALARGIDSRKNKRRRLTTDEQFLLADAVSIGDANSKKRTRDSIYVHKQYFLANLAE